jgi:hypothetical protein
MKKLLFLVVVLFYSTTSIAQETSFFSNTDVFLKKYVHAKKVNYEAIKKDPKTLEDLVKQIATFSLSNDPKVNKAFFINAYNIVMINAIVEKYPIKSPMDITGVFDKTKYTVAGTKLTLNDIENKMIREKYKDARIHFVLVCGANGCPPITNFAYTPENLEQQLEQQTKLAINNPDFIKVNVKSKKVEISQIFEWYKDDFVSTKSSYIDFLNKYKSEPIPTNFKVAFYTYDWSLNKH